MYFRPHELEEKTMTLSSSIYHSKDLTPPLSKSSYITNYTTNFGRILESTHKLLDDLKVNFNLKIGQPYMLSTLKSSSHSYTGPSYRNSNYLGDQNTGFLSSYDLKRTQYLPKRDTNKLIEESRGLIEEIRASIEASKAELSKYENPADLREGLSERKKSEDERSHFSTTLEEVKSDKKPHSAHYYGLEEETHKKMLNDLKQSLDQVPHASSMTFNDQIHTYIPRSPDKNVHMISPRSPEEENQFMGGSFGSQEVLKQAEMKSLGKNVAVSGLGKIEKGDHKKTIKNQRGITLLQNAIKEANAYIEDPNQLVEVSELKSDFNSSEFIREQDEGKYLRTNQSGSSLKYTDKNPYSSEVMDAGLNLEEESPRPNAALRVTPQSQTKMANEKVSLKMVGVRPKSKENRNNPMNPVKAFSGFKGNQENNPAKGTNKGVKRGILTEKNMKNNQIGNGKVMQGKGSGLFKSVQNR